MAMAQRKLGKRFGYRAALQHQPKSGGKPGAIRAGFAMNQRRFLHILENRCQAQDAVLMRRAAAFKGRVYMGQAKARSLCPAERICAAIGAIAAQIDHGADAMMPRGQPYLPGQRVVGPVKPARCHHAPIPPAQPQNGVIYEKRIAPGGGGGHALLFQPRA
jgi:hypothetical protein